MTSAWAGFYVYIGDSCGEDLRAERCLPLPSLPHDITHYYLVVLLIGTTPMQGAA